MATGSVPITAGSGTPIRIVTNAGVDSGADQQVMTLADSAGNLLGTSAAPLPIMIAGGGGLAPTAGTISAAATNTPGTAVTASTTGQIVSGVSLAGNVTFHLVTSNFNGTLVFEASVDAGLNYAPIMAIREDGTGSENSTTLAAAAAFIRLYTAALPGLAYFRVRCSAFTSGTVAVILAPGPTLMEPNPSLSASTATIGTVLETSSQMVTALSAVATAVTLTLAAPGAGLRHYITGIWFERYISIATTGAASGFVTTSANSNIVFNLPSDTQAIGTAGIVIGVTFSSPVATTALNTATTFTAPAVAGTQYRISASYYTAP